MIKRLAPLIACHLLALPALASEFYTLNFSSNIHRWSGTTATLISTVPSLANPEGLAAAPDGTIYACGWNGFSFHRINPSNGQWTQLPPVQPTTLGSFFKDLAWDPSTNSLMALHYSQVPGQAGVIKNRLFSIDVNTMQSTLIGDITGLVPTGSADPTATGLAVDANGNRFLQIANQIYTLGTGLNAQPLPTVLGSPGITFNGLAAGPDGLIVSGSGLWTVNPDGSATVLSAVSGNYRDVAFAIPSPGTLALAAATLCVASRRRRN